ncbi:MAG: aminotransferase class I/II-fold pyridoxal phosphate-dependent enzyme [Legionella sp.]|nr:MAG: aminotransferase class I/II-fold pyridoxal phosphate-dependent enzyme [Legionella sp.]
MTLDKEIARYTHALAEKGLLRTRSVFQKNTEQFIHFDSNDYLSLSEEPAITQAYQEGYQRYPCGSGGSMLLSGYHETHRAVEQAFAEWLEVDDCILFSSGYAANLAITSLLGQIKALCLIDKGVHASTYDGLNLAQVEYKRYQHNDLHHLRQQLDTFPIQALLTEGIFGMSGMLSPLDEIANLCRTKNTVLLVDEAHSFGILGDRGKGSIAKYGLTQKEVPLRTIAFGKAYAAQGALIAGQKNWIHALLQAGRSLIYSTAISPAISYGLGKTLDVIIAAEDRRNKLQELIGQFREHIMQSPLQWSDSLTPIQQLQLGCPYLALHYSQELKAQGILCSAIRPPTVSLKATGLRIILNYRHTPQQITRLFLLLSQLHEHTPS